MLINHPILGPRDAAEFTYLGDAALIDRPELAGGRRSQTPSTITFTCATTPQVCTASCGSTNRATALGWW